VWEAGGVFFDRRFWRASHSVRAASIKARRGRTLNSPLAFEFAKGAVVGQAHACEFVDGILRLEVFDPTSDVNNEPMGTSAQTGWVTLSAEEKGGSRFFIEASVHEVEALSEAFGLQQCIATTLSADTLDNLQQTSFKIGQRSCSVPDSGPLCNASGQVDTSPVKGILELDSDVWTWLSEAPYSEELWLLATYTPWCLQCVQMMSEWAELARGSMGKRTHVVALNCHASSELCDELDLPGHPLMAAVYAGSDAAVHRALAHWNQGGDGEQEWLPANWSFWNPGKLATLLAELPLPFQPRDAARVAPTVPNLCLHSVKVAGALSSGGGMGVGVDWPHSEGVVHEGVQGEGGAALSDGFQALADSLDGSGHAFLGIRWLSAIEAWLRVVVARLPSVLPVVSALMALADLAGAALARVLARGGNYSVCSSDWETWVRPAADALRGAIANHRGKCRDPRCRVWSLLHGLATSSPATDSSGLDLLEAFWALIAADSAGLLSKALGGPAIVAELVEALREGRYGTAELASEGATTDRAHAALLLWRLHGVASAKSALDCQSQGGALPDLRWPPSSLCPDCWRKCFRQRRLCWEPWEDQRRKANAELPKGFVDALPNEAAVLAFLSSRFNWSNTTFG